MEKTLVFVDNNRIVTDSLTVAEVFEKEHARVMRDIRDLGCSEEFRLGNFAESSYTNAQGREMPKIIMTEQGLVILVMGYTGKKAMYYKEAYIAEFERMKMELSNRSVGFQPSYMIADPIARAERWIEEEKERQALQAQTQQLDQQVAIMQPKANYYDSILSSKDTMVITQIAKDYGLSGRKLNAILHEAHLIYKVNDEWVLYADHHDKGYTKSSTIKIEHHDGRVGTKLHTRWTQQGRVLIHEVLAKHGITPVSDRNDK